MKRQRNDSFDFDSHRSVREEIELLNDPPLQALTRREDIQDDPRNIRQELDLIHLPKDIRNNFYQHFDSVRDFLNYHSTCRTLKNVIDQNPNDQYKNFVNIYDFFNTISYIQTVFIDSGTNVTTKEDLEEEYSNVIFLNDSTDLPTGVQVLNNYYLGLYLVKTLKDNEEKYILQLNQPPSNLYNNNCPDIVIVKGFEKMYQLQIIPDKLYADKERFELIQYAIFNQLDKYVYDEWKECVCSPYEKSQNQIDLKEKLNSLKRTSVENNYVTLRNLFRQCGP